MPVSRYHLPRLAMGNREAKEGAGIESLHEMLEAFLPDQWDVLQRGGVSRFFFRASLVRFGAVRLVCLSSTPVVVKRDWIATKTLLFMESGTAKVNVARRRFGAVAGETGVFLSGAPRLGFMEPGYSAVEFALDAERFGIVAGGMLGCEECAVPGILDFSRDRELPMSIGRVRFGRLLRSYCELIDQYENYPWVLQQLGLDDLILRTLVTLLSPATFFDPAVCRPDMGATGAFDRVCEYIDGNLDQPLTLSMIERASGLSARTLQQHFRQRFGCTPMQWVRLQRLDGAHRLLLTGQGDATILEIALRCGFNHPSMFSRYYAERFGELPSATLRRVRQQR